MLREAWARKVRATHISVRSIDQAELGVRAESFLVLNIREGPEEAEPSPRCPHQLLMIERSEAAGRRHDIDVYSSPERSQQGRAKWACREAVPLLQIRCADDDLVFGLSQELSQDADRGSAPYFVRESWPERSRAGYHELDGVRRISGHLR